MRYTWRAWQWALLLWGGQGGTKCNLPCTLLTHSLQALQGPTHKQGPVKFHRGPGVFGLQNAGRRCLNHTEGSLPHGHL